MPGIEAISLFSLVLIPFLAADAISGLLMQRAVLHVVKIFREHNAIGINNARTVKDLGLTDEENLPPQGIPRSANARSGRNNPYGRKRNPLHAEGKVC